jgi:hypothetical protein
MDYIEELAKAKKALADKPAEAQRERGESGQEGQEASQFLDRLRHFLLDNGSPGRAGPRQSRDMTAASE